MKFLVLATVFSAVSASALFERAVCNRDNCARAIIGTYKGEAQVTSRKNDCSSYQLVTDYVIKTTTITSGSVSSTKSATPAKNTLVTPTHIPKYATKAECTGTRYESACLNCASVTRRTTTKTETATVIVPTKK